MLDMPLHPPVPQLRSYVRFEKALSRHRKARAQIPVVTQQT